MNNFVIDTPDNFWQIRWLDKYMEGHKGFIAGDGKIVTDHLWFDLTKGFESADLLPGDVVEFCARVSIYEKGYKGYRNDVFDRPIEKDYRLSRPTKIKKIGKKSID